MIQLLPLGRSQLNGFWKSSDAIPQILNKEKSFGNVEFKNIGE